MKTAIAFAVLALIVSGFAVLKSPVVTEFGAAAGPEHFVKQIFSAGSVDGGERVVVTPVTSTVTITAGQMDRAKILTFTASSTQAALTATLPASTTFPLMKTGESRTWIIENPFTAAATTTTIAAGAGVDLQEPDGQNVVIGINNYALLTCVKGADSGSPADVVCAVDETIPAD